MSLQNILNTVPINIRKQKINLRNEFHILPKFKTVYSIWLTTGYVLSNIFDKKPSLDLDNQYSVYILDYLYNVVLQRLSILPSKDIKRLVIMSITYTGARRKTETCDLRSPKMALQSIVTDKYVILTITILVTLRSA